MKTRGSPEYRTWRGAKARCLNPNATGYANYGGRGIRMCDRWIHSFAAFIEDMGPRPPGATLDRIDNDGDYAPGNCRWATRAEQTTNQRTNHRITIDGVTQTISQWARAIGLPAATIHWRLANGWTERDAVLTPVEPIRLEIHGVTRTIDEWSDETGLLKRVIFLRLRRGWPPERAVGAPVRRRLLTFDGRTLNVAEWSRLVNINEQVLRARLALGWDDARVITTPLLERADPVTFNGQTRTISEWAAQYGINRVTLSSRLDKGWRVERAITTPARYRTPKHQ